MIWEKLFRKLFGMGDPKAIKDVRFDHRENPACVNANEQRINPGHVNILPPLMT